MSDRQREALWNFVQAGGAWRCSAMPWQDAAVILEWVLESGSFYVPIGPAGAGRWSSASALKVFLTKTRQGSAL